MPPLLSIIIPTLNEEGCLGALLQSLQKQTFIDYEIIVADAGSTDQTRVLATNLGARVTVGGLPAVGRNAGAQVASGRIFLFLDADMYLSASDYLSDCLREFEQRKLDFATCALAVNEQKPIDRLLLSVYNFYTRATTALLPHTPGFCIFVRREIHERLHGFDETVVFAEDMDYGRRAQTLGRFAFLRAHRIAYCNRRLERDGRIATSLRYFLAEFYMLFFGPIRSDIFRYRFGHPPKNNGKASACK